MELAMKKFNDEKYEDAGYIFIEMEDYDHAITSFELAKKYDMVIRTITKAGYDKEEKKYIKYHEKMAQYYEEMDNLVKAIDEMKIIINIHKIEGSHFSIGICSIKLAVLFAKNHEYIKCFNKIFEFREHRTCNNTYVVMAKLCSVLSIAGLKFHMSHFKNFRFDSREYDFIQEVDRFTNCHLHNYKKFEEAVDEYIKMCNPSETIRDMINTVIKKNHCTSEDVTEEDASEDVTEEDTSDDEIEEKKKILLNRYFVILHKK